jgi:uridine kinase
VLLQGRRKYSVQFQQLYNKIDKLLKLKEYVIVAIDGMSAAGKSFFANILKETYSCNVIAMDSFFLRPIQRTPERFAKPGGNIDYERFYEEVILPLKSGGSFSYRPFDCKSQNLAEPITVSVNPLTVIEGVYSMHPKFTKSCPTSRIYDASIFMTVDESLQRQRLLTRNPDLYERFINEWIPLENNYFEHFKIQEKCEFLQ